MSLETYLLAFVGVSTGIVGLLFLVLILVYLTSSPSPDYQLDADECSYIDSSDNCCVKPFPTLKEPGSITLSIVVPSYNEELRLPIMLDEAIEYLERKCKGDSSFKYEIIIVDDGSRDKTTQVGLKYCEKYGSNKIRVLSLKRNRGKGGAIRAGFLCSRGRLLLFADADGATRFADYSRLEKSIKEILKHGDGVAIVCGSRSHLGEESSVKRDILRKLVSHGFHLLVWTLCVRTVKDTQCGFKLLSRSAARLLFLNMHVERWAFDVDLLYLAEHFRVPIAEIPVDWQEIPGTKLIPVFSWLQMAKDIVLIRLRYMLGAWKIDPKYEWD